MGRCIGWGGRSDFGLCSPKAEVAGVGPDHFEKEGRRPHWGGSSQSMGLHSDCDMVGTGHLELWNCTASHRVCGAYASGCNSTLWKGREKQEGFTRRGGNSPRNRICCPPSVVIWRCFAGCGHIHLPRALGNAEMKPGCTLHIHGELWLGTAESWTFILL